MPALIDKQEAHRLVDQLGDDASWEDLAYLAYLHAKLERGRREHEQGLGVSHQEMRRRFGLES